MTPHGPDRIGSHRPPSPGRPRAWLLAAISGAALLVVGGLVGCGAREGANAGSGTGSDEPSDSLTVPQETIDALRSLPYAGSTNAPEGDPTGVVRRDPDRICRGNRLVTIGKLCRAEMIDDEGEVVRFWTDPVGQRWERAILLDDGGIFVIGADPHEWENGPSDVRIADEERFIQRFDVSGRSLWKRYLRAHHDGDLRPDGTIDVLTFERRLVPKIHPEIDTRIDGITRVDLVDGSTLEPREMLSAVLASPSVFPLGPVVPDGLGGPTWVDLFHSNSIEWMREEALFGTHPAYSPDHVLVSFRQQDRVAIFDTVRNVVVWAWGKGHVRGPHDAQLLPGGTILLLDNGLGRFWSRAVEVDPRTDEIVWEWSARPRGDFSTPTKGSAQRLPNGNTLLAESDRGRAIEITPEGEIVWEWICPHRIGRKERATIVRMQWVGSGEAPESD